MKTAGYLPLVLQELLVCLVLIVALGVGSLVMSQHKALKPLGPSFTHFVIAYSAVIAGTHGFILYDYLQSRSESNLGRSASD
jgi:hypothetical protein